MNADERRAQQTREASQRYRLRSKGVVVPLLKPGTKLGQRTKSPKHGTLHEYSRHGCRCELCKACARENSRKYRQRNPIKHLASVKRTQRKNRERVRIAKARPCADCGVQYPYYVMQFDHLKDKKFNLSSKVHRIGRAKVEAEIAKCDVVCANCHAERTYQRMIAKKAEAA